ncbi:receptor-type tyrosine-protein phosphatase F-like [Clavelina lepadiformis]|uniref:receptor-type tyrosine-protein phosphatase F-like n=1 Tax=Clavelina lepadiformis TaxID=159417 RepID=UPI004041632E
MTQQAVLYFLLYTNFAVAIVRPPTGLTRSGILSTEFTMVWDVVDDVNYKIAVVEYLSTTSRNINRPPNTTDVLPPFRVNQTTVGGAIRPNTNHNIFLFAINPTNSSDFNRTVFNRLTTAPSAPVDVRVTRTKSTQFRVSWRHRNLGPGYHNVRRYSVIYGASDGQTRRKSTANRVSYLDVRNVTANTNYSVKVYGQIRRGVRTDDSSSITVTTVFGKPPSPILTSVTSSNIAVRWSAPDAGGGATNIIAYVISWDHEHHKGLKVIFDANAATIGGLSPNTSYSVTLAARSSAGDGDSSDPIVVTTKSIDEIMETSIPAIQCRTEASTSSIKQTNPPQNTLSNSLKSTPSPNGARERILAKPSSNPVVPITVVLVCCVLIGLLAGVVYLYRRKKKMQNDHFQIILSNMEDE